LSDYRVNLEIFAGPMDLLLYLVRKEEVDIYDIQLTKITEQYLHYIEMLQHFDIDVAGDFLVMASTLMQIKSSMLLPKADPDHLDGEDLFDSRTELIRQLLEYKKFKDAANLLSDARGDQDQRYPRPGTIIDNLKPDSEPKIDLEQVSVWDLLEAFDAIMVATGGASFDVSHIVDDTPIDLYQIEILNRLQTDGPMTFARLFESRKSRSEMVGLFLALLELVRDNLVWTEQAKPFEPIYLKAMTEEPAELAVQRAIVATEQQMIEQQQQRQNEQPELAAENTEHQIPSVRISEMPEKPKTEKEIVVSSDSDQIPIAELPAKDKNTDPEKELEPVEEQDKELPEQSNYNIDSDLPAH